MDPSPLSAIDAKPRLSWLMLLAIVPAVAPLLLLKRYHVNLIWNDAWDLALLLSKSHQGALRITDFFTPHNEHLMPVPYALMYVLAKLTGWDTRVESLVGYGLVCILAAGLGMLLRSIHAPGRSWVWAWLVMVLLLFSPMQVENWMFGFCACQNFLPIPCLVWAMVLIRRHRASLLAVGLGGVLVAIASFSLANGLMQWVLVAPVIVSSSLPRRRLYALAMWIVMMVASLAVYAACYNSPAMPTEYYSAVLTARVRFFLMFLGIPLSYGSANVQGWAMAGGGLIVVLYLMLMGWIILALRNARSEVVDSALPWVAIGMYGFGGALLGAIGRAGLGAGQATISRYTTISSCALIGIIGLLIVGVKFGDPRRWRQIATPLFSLVSLAVLLGGVRSVPHYINANRHSRTAMAYLCLINQHMDARGPLLIAFRSDLRELANQLNQAGYLHPPLINDPDISHLASSGTNAIGAVERIQTTGPETLRAIGWGVLPDGRRNGDVVLITRTGDAGKDVLISIADINMDAPGFGTAQAERFQSAWWTADIPASEKVALRFWVFDAVAQQAYPLAIRER